MHYTLKEISTDDLIFVKAIGKGGAARKSALKLLYSNVNLQQKVRKWILSNSGTLEDAEDVLHDGVLVLDRNIRNNKFRMEGSIEQYLTSICRFLWLSRLRKQAQQKSLEKPQVASLNQEDNPELILIRLEKKQHLESLLSKMDGRCLKILTMWKQSYSMKEIAKVVGLSSPALAKKYRYRCTQKMMRLLQEDTALYNALKALK